METQALYQNIARRTGGDIYIGVAEMVAQSPQTRSASRVVEPD